MTSKFAVAPNNFVGRAGLSVRHMTYHVIAWTSRDGAEPIKARNRAPTPIGPLKTSGSCVSTLIDLNASDNLRQATRDAIASA